MQEVPEARRVARCHRCLLMRCVRSGTGTSRAFICQWYPGLRCLPTPSGFARASASGTATVKPFRLVLAGILRPPHAHRAAAHGRERGGAHGEQAREHAQASTTLARLRAPQSLHPKMRLAEESAPPRARRAQACARVRAHLRSRVRERIAISARACRQRSGVGPGWG